MIKFRPASTKTNSNKDEYSREVQTLLRLAGVEVDLNVHRVALGLPYIVFRHGRLEYKIGAVRERHWNTVVTMEFIVTEVSPGEFSRKEPSGITVLPTRRGSGKNARKEYVDRSVIDDRWMLALDCRLSIIEAASRLHAFMQRMETEHDSLITDVQDAERCRAENKRVVSSVAGSLGLRRIHSWSNEYKTPFDGLTLRMDEDSGLVSEVKFDLSIPAAAIVEILPALAELVEAAARAAGAKHEGV